MYKHTLQHLLSVNWLRRFFTIFNCLLLAMFSTVSLANTNETKQISDVELFSQAVEFSLQEQWGQAEDIYRDLIKRHKEWPEPANNLAVLLLKTHRIDEAKLVLEQAVVSSPAFRVAQKNRSQLYNYLATQAYDKALGAEQSAMLPELELINTIHQPVKVIEVEVEKIVIQKVPVESVAVINTATDVPDKKSSNAASEIISNKPAKKNDIEVQVFDQDDISERIKQQLNTWSHAWSQGDFENYIQMYSRDFLPSDSRKSYVQWKNIRHARLKFTKGVNIVIEQPRVFIEPSGNYALVEFIQKYKSDSYSDRVLKQVYMGLEQEKWLILSERTIKIY